MKVRTILVQGMGEGPLQTPPYGVIYTYASKRDILKMI
jgi:hypothetical protein